MNPMLYGWLAHGLLITAVTRLCLPHAGRWASRLAPGLMMALSLAAGLALAFVPLPVIGNLAAWCHGVVSTPSIPLLLLALCTCLGLHRPALPSARPGWAAAGLGLLFYLSALGLLGPFDIYRFGFGPHPVLLFGLALLMPALYHYRQTFWLWALSASMAGYALGLYDNLWNALFDPILFTLLILSCFRKASAKKNKAHD